MCELKAMLIFLSILWSIFVARLANGFALDRQQFQHYDGFKLFRAIPVTNSQIDALKNLSKSVGIRSEMNEGIEFWKFSRHLGVPTEIFTSNGEEEKLRRFLRQNHIFHQKVIEDFGIQMREIGETMRHDEPVEFIGNLQEFDLGKYHRYEAIVQYLQILAKMHPAFINLASLGKTFEGRELAMIKMGYPNGSPKPILLLDAGIHAREWIAPAIAMHVINALVNDPKWHSLLREIDVHVIPVMNPDGYVHSWDKNRLWRRTRSGPYSTTGFCLAQMDSEWNKAEKTFGEKSLCFGADPNRNFPYHWAESGTDACPCSEVFPGPGVLSEVECAHLAEYMRANRQQIKAYLTLHAYGNLLIHAWNYAQHTYPQDVADIKLVANQMVNAIQMAGGPKFTVGSAPDILYEAAGGSDDYASSLGIKYSYTLELTDGQFGQFFGGFIYPEKGINQEATKILPGIHVLANKVKENGNNF